MPKKINIKVDNKTKEFIIKSGENLLRALQDNNIYITAPCAGQSKCGKCKVYIHKSASHNSEYSEVLACQTIVNSDLYITIPQSDNALIQSESYFPDLQLTYDSNEPNHYGIAVDIGTTTVVVYLEDLHLHKNLDTRSFLNPQKAFGADVISRIQYAKNEENITKLQQALLSELRIAIESLSSKNNLTAQQIAKVTITGNTTMLHLFLGVDPSSLATYPFNPVFLEEKNLSSKELDLIDSANCEIQLMPSISAFVGADIVAGIAATELTDEEHYSLFLDIGTNGEMALGNKNQLLCCATAAGPAFEGAKISCGLGGVSGAIHQFDESSFKTIGDSLPTGLCGSGLIDLIATLLNQGKLDPSGYLESEITFLEEYNLKLQPQDIREVQLAKGAIIAGIYTLINKAEITIDKIEKVFLAGGFGYAIDPKSAVRIGLLPQELEHKVIRTGNTAGLGARLFLHSEAFKKRANEVAQKAQHFDLSVDMDFNELFVMNMNFPN